MSLRTLLRPVAGAWQWVGDLGQLPEHSLERSKRLRLTNQVATFTASLSLPYILFYAILGIVPAATIALIGMSTYVFVLWLNHRGRYQLATPLLLSVGNLHIASVAWLLGADAGVHFFLVAAAMSPFLYYSPYEMRPAAFFSLLSLLLYLALELSFALAEPLYRLPPEFERFSYVSTFIANFIAVAVFTYYLYQENIRVEGALELERERSDHLLLNILPSLIAERLKQGESPIADFNEQVSILFADIVGFTPLTSRLKADELVVLLDELFTRFDEEVTQLNLEKMRTIGDGYFVAAGVPQARDDHALVMAQLALNLQRAVKEFDSPYVSGLQIRIGISSGSVIAGVIGARKIQYDLWGDTVNIASRMESQGAAGKIQISETTYALIKDKFACTSRGEVEIKGKGKMRTWFLDGPLPEGG